MEAKSLFNLTMCLGYRHIHPLMRRGLNTRNKKTHKTTLYKENPENHKKVCSTILPDKDALFKENGEMLKKVCSTSLP